MLNQGLVKNSQFWFSKHYINMGNLFICCGLSLLAKDLKLQWIFRAKMNLTWLDLTCVRDWPQDLSILKTITSCSPAASMHCWVWSFQRNSQYVPGYSTVKQTSCHCHWTNYTYKPRWAVIRMLNSLVDSCWCLPQLRKLEDTVYSA